MSEENNNSNNDLSREELNDELDKVKQSNRPESFFKRAGVITCYRTSQPYEQEQGQEDNDELDRTNASNSQHTNQAKSHSLWSYLLSFLWIIVGICILLPYEIIVSILLIPIRICKDIFSHKDYGATTTCYLICRRDDLYWASLLGMLLIIGGLIYLIYSLINYYFFNQL